MIVSAPFYLTLTQDSCLTFVLSDIKTTFKNLSLTTFKQRLQPEFLDLQQNSLRFSQNITLF